MKLNDIFEVQYDMEGYLTEAERGIMNRIKEIVAKNAGYIKPIIAMGILSSALQTMGTAAAEETLNTIDNLNGTEYQQAVDDLKQGMKQFDDLRNIDAKKTVNYKQKSPEFQQAGDDLKQGMKQFDDLRNIDAKATVNYNK